MNTNSISLKNRTLQSAAKLYQYDYGQQLEFHGIDLPEAFEVHFSNTNLGEATRHIGQNNIVVIPDIYLESGEPLFGWLFLHNEADDGETVYKFRIPVIKRASIVEREIPETEQDIITQAIAVLNTAVESTEQNVSAAVEAKNTAEEIRDTIAQAIEQSAEHLQTISDKEQNVLRAEREVNDTLLLVNQQTDQAFSAAREANASAESAAEIKSQTEDLLTSAETQAQNLLSSAEDQAQDLIASASAQAQIAQNSAVLAGQHVSTVIDIADQIAPVIDQVEASAGEAREAQRLAECAQELAETARDDAALAKAGAEAARDEAREYINELPDIAGTISATAEQVEKIKEILANQYSSEIPYPDVGSYVIQNDSLWISVVAINEPEEWTEEHWAKVAVGTRLMELQEAISIIMKMEQTKNMSFRLLKRICESGHAQEYFSEGSVIYIPWTDYSKDTPVEYSLPFVVMGFENVYDINGDLHENAMIIMSMYAQPIEIPFDAAESKRAISTNFVPGYYYYTLSNGIYTQRSVPYGNPIPSSPTYYVSNKPSSGNILRYGYGRWAQSAYRQWLNSDKDTGWWQTQHDCDIAPADTYTNQPGWLYGFNSDWREFLKPRRIQTAYSNGVDTTYDIFFLPSLEQMYGEPSYPGVEGSYWDYWKDETGLVQPANGSASNTNDARKIPSVANPEGASVTVMTRSGHPDEYSVWSMHANGYFYLDSASNARRSMPACALF